MRNAPVPSSFLCYFTWFSPVAPCLVLRDTETDTALGRDLSSVEGSGRITPLHLLGTFLLMPPRKCNSSLLQGHSAASCSTWCPPGARGPFVQSCCPGSWLLAYPGVYLLLAVPCWSTSVLIIYLSSRQPERGAALTSPTLILGLSWREL